MVDATGAEIPSEQVYASSIGGADGIVSPGEELDGRVLRVSTGTTVNRFAFLANNVFRIEDSSGDLMVQGTYRTQGSDVCVDWAPRGQECWPGMMSASGTETTITSNRGQEIKILLIDS
ncbi:hypothetical protein GRI44_01040 [Altererythrobacter confluentis]|uniref:Uncharacterized protein n=1 Tax=Allopontixanthobacter confluentis TaxID=1849021 RepID=A0A6L7GFB3_9SPHN|nr:hypothetical protein [Allopontixanthobacter confluentis]MXP13341.1 hypothetical protein [Allopontixanthobacter confluentis]